MRTASGGPTFPSSIRLVTDGLNRMITEVKDVGLLAGISGSNSVTIINLQHVDDTLLFGNTDIRQGIMLKWILCCFEV